MRMGLLQGRHQNKHGTSLQAVKQLSSTVAEMAHLITGASFDPFLRSSHEKCGSLWSAFERLHASVVADIGDLIDGSFRQALHHQAEELCHFICHSMTSCVGPTCHGSMCLRMLY